MNDLVFLLFSTDCSDGAVVALDEAKRLDRHGWIEIMDYILFKKDEKGHVTLRRMDDERLEQASATAVGVTGGVVGAALGGGIGAVAGTAAGALIGVKFARYMEDFEHEQFLRQIPDSLPQSSSALVLLIEERYAERLEEEFDKLGRTAVRSLNAAERDAELHAYLRRSKNRIRSFEIETKALSARLHDSTGAQKRKLETELASERAESQITREKLLDHINEMCAELYAELRDLNARLASTGRAAKSELAAGVDHVHRELDGLTSDAETLIEDRIEIFQEEASELTNKLLGASAEMKPVVETHLLSVESRLRKEREDLIDSFEQRLLHTKQWFNVLGVRCALAKPESRNEKREAIHKAQDALAEIKSRVRMRQPGDESACKEIRQKFDQTWKELAGAFDQMSRHHA